MANHRPFEHAWPSSLSATQSQWAAPVKGKFGPDFTLMSPRTQSLSAGDEIFLRYGTHPNRKLFVEYGFVNIPGSCEAQDKVPKDGQVDLRDLVLEALGRRDDVGAWMQNVLEEHGYWG
jgi:hypothetical protein